MVGLAVCKTAHGHHSGFVYKNDAGETRILHLAFHHDLRDEAVNDDYRWVQVGLDIDSKIILAGLLETIISANPSIPYGFNGDGICFDPVTGELISAPPGSGLTCATFISAVMELFGYRIIDIDTWVERPDDAVWRNNILKILEDYASNSHVKSVVDSPHATRVRPEEIVSAGSLFSEKWPAKMTDIEVMASEIITELAL